MHLRLRIILPALGLLVFTAQTYKEYRAWQTEKPSRYFWWSSLRLDSDPLNHRPYPIKRADAAESGEATWVLRDRWVDPPYVVTLLIYSGFPAFMITVAIVGVLGRLGISEILSFLVSAPVLLATWYYFVGRLLDRWLRKKGTAIK